MPGIFRCVHDASACLLIAVHASDFRNAASSKVTLTSWEVHSRLWRFNSCGNTWPKSQEIAFVLSLGEALSKMCTGAAACATGAAGNGSSAWVLGSWSTCSERCGGGLINRTLRRGATITSQPSVANTRGVWFTARGALPSSEDFEKSKD